jgi:CRP-like cAMP-binding protein
MNTADRLRALRSLRLEGLLPYFDEVIVRAGDELAVEGRLCHQFFVVVDGALETCRGGVRGELLVGQGFGWAAMRERGVNEASVRAVGDARLLVMGHEQFRAADGLEPKQVRLDPNGPIRRPKLVRLDPNGRIEG